MSLGCEERGSGVTFELGAREDNKQQDKDGKGFRSEGTEVWKDATAKVSREKWTETRVEGSLEPVV